MKVTGIIVEYNPLHNGHLYHIEETKKITDADYCIAVISGNYVQRGEPAIMDKYLRTRAALACGVDLVLELPVCYSTGSAEFFASGAVSLLDKLGVVNTLCFGSEWGETKLLAQIAKVLVQEPESYTASLKSHLKQGRNFPSARALALSDWFKQEGENETHTCSAVNIREPSFSSCMTRILSEPNNVLGIEYIKALLKRHSSIIPVTITRKGSYHSHELLCPYPSATAIRKEIVNQTDLTGLAACVPPFAFHLMQEQYQRRFPIFPDDFSSCLMYKLLSDRNGRLTEYMDVSDDLEKRIKHNLTSYSTFTELSLALNTRAFTHTRINRCLLHILLDLFTEDMHLFRRHDDTGYARILGFRKNSSALLTEIKKHSSVPLLTKLADKNSLLNPLSLKMLEQDIFAGTLYYQIMAEKFHCTPLNEFTAGVILQ